jgi:HPt (histidine-containing phosphotransfer) domain-containing protein
MMTTECAAIVELDTGLNDLILDLDFLRGNLSAMGDDLNESLGLLMEIYEEEFPVLALQMREALAVGDADLVRRMAHTLKSSCGSLGAIGLSGICQRLEGLARSADLVGVAELLPEFDRLNRLTHEALADCRF